MLSRFRAALLGGLLLAADGYGQSLKVPPTVSGDPGAFLQIAAETDCPTVKWIAIDPGLNLFPSALLKDTKVAVVSGNKPGKYRVLAIAAKGDVPADPVVCTVTILGEVVPPAPGPVPPGPNPGPTPAPVPVPDPAPISGPGNRVLIVYDTAKLAALPAEQVSVLTAQAVRQHLNEKCAPGPDGKSKEWRIWDTNILDLSGESESWQKAVKRPRATLPWIVISNGTTGYEGPLPANVDSTIELLKKWEK